MKYNIKNYNVESPFYNEVLIIDEVHNFVRQIINNTGSARHFMNGLFNLKM